MRFMRFLNWVDWDNIGRSTFWTLTYPDDVMTFDYTERSKHRFLFMRHLERMMGKNKVCIWHYEWKERLTGWYAGKICPHLHLMTLDVPWLSKAEVTRRWGQSIGYKENDLHVRLREIDNGAGAARYLAKYVSKGSRLAITAHHNSPIKFGRHWGCTRKELLPLHPVVVNTVLNAAEVALAQEYARKRWPSYGQVYAGSFTLLSADTAKFLAEAFGRRLDVAEGEIVESHHQEGT